MDQLRHRNQDVIHTSAPALAEPVVTADKLERAKSLLAKGLTVREAATRLKIGKSALYAALNPEPGPAC